MTTEDATGSAGISPPTPFELEVSDAAETVLLEAKTGYNWGKVDQLLAAELTLDGIVPATRCKKASGSGRAANVLTESNDKSIDLYLIFIIAPYSATAFRAAATDRIGRFPNVKTVAIAEKVGETWRVTGIIERSDVNFAETIRPHFPLVEEVTFVEDTTETGDPDTSPSQGAFSLKSVDLDVFESQTSGTATKVDGLGQLAALLVEHAELKRIQISAAVAVDLLACFLSSQFLLFAGPSGTGKSTCARLMADFLADPDAVAVLEARAGWAGPEDVVGYFSSLTSKFAHTPNTPLLTGLHEYSTAIESNGDLSSPVLVVEEANLSPIEGYLASFTHGLSSPETPAVVWHIHAQHGGATDSEGSVELPATLVFGPWPRVLGTINVDANSVAPAPKVSARAAVILLEPDLDLDVDAEVARLGAAAFDADLEAKTRPPRRIVGDPSSARRSMNEGQLRTLLSSFKELLVVMGGSEPLVPSRRDIVRALNFMSYFALLASEYEPDSQACAKVASENAVLHTVLSQLPAERFGQALQNLEGSSLSDSQDAGGLGGLLAARVKRLAGQRSGSPFAEALDFWTSLS